MTPKKDLLEEIELLRKYIEWCDPDNWSWPDWTPEDTQRLNQLQVNRELNEK
jgi:hypothetical protein